MTKYEVINNVNKMMRSIIDNPGKINVEKVLIAICKTQLFLLEQENIDSKKESFNDIFPWLKQ